MLMYYDAHTHLNSDQLYPDREHHLEDFFAAGGAGLVNIGVNHERNQRAITISKQRNSKLHTRKNKPTNIPPVSKCNEETLGGLGNSQNNIIKATIGLHPGETTRGNIKRSKDITKEIEKLKTLYKQNKEHIVAIGECGVDSHFERNDTIQDLQTQLFREQCVFAQEIGLPVVIHSRDNFKLTYNIIKDYTDLKIYFHCRGYGPKQIEQLVNICPQLRIGFCGNTTYPKAHLLKESFEYIVSLLQKNEAFHQTPSHFTGPNLLLETDAPYLSPQSKRGTTNIPPHIVDLYSWVSETYTISSDTVQTYLKNSFFDLYLQQHTHQLP